MGKHQCHVILFSNLICFLSEVIFSMRNGGGGHESREDNSWTQRPMTKKERVRLLEPGVAAEGGNRFRSRDGYEAAWEDKRQALGAGGGFSKVSGMAREDRWLDTHWASTSDSTVQPPATVGNVFSHSYRPARRLLNSALITWFHAGCDDLWSLARQTSAAQTFVTIINSMLSMSLVD